MPNETVNGEMVPSSSEGGLGAPTRHPIEWEDPKYYDEEDLDSELRRVFDICHGCRRCFNLCDSFPRLFDLIDESDSGELDSVESEGFKSVVDACTFCDMCFLTKCPYVPPHEFNVDFPHLMLRYRAVENSKNQVPVTKREISKTDRNGKVASTMSGLVNWASSTDNVIARSVIEKTTSIDRRATLPKFSKKSFSDISISDLPEINKAAPAYGRKAIIYATCFINYNNPLMGELTRKVLAHNGVTTEIIYPSCCGMPQLEQGDLMEVSNKAKRVATEMQPWIDKGYDVISLTPSCSLMLKFEWPLILPDNNDVLRLAEATSDISEYIVKLSKDEGLVEGLSQMPGPIALHLACHSRAQNMGQKATELLRLIPDIDLNVIERCSGHGGTWGIYKDNFETSIKVGRPVANKSKEAAYIVSECPLAADHILQGLELLSTKQSDSGEKKGKTVPSRSFHPVELFAAAYGFNFKDK
ncbi:MAG: glycerol-3-phosphate dehydrogenase [Alphaproteobacteria bacterium]|nr:glycerol-3-phosphate dehydrogenase [Alphaproteobacteria bacterium]|tara:strand:- start:554 stop:1966 length:1413 start_codon:yes stop_codon:yes gene_type:complete